MHTRYTSCRHSVRWTTLAAYNGYNLYRFKFLWIRTLLHNGSTHWRISHTHTNVYNRVSCSSPFGAASSSWTLRLYSRILVGRRAIRYACRTSYTLLYIYIYAAFEQLMFGKQSEFRIGKYSDATYHVCFTQIASNAMMILSSTQRTPFVVSFIESHWRSICMPVLVFWRIKAWWNFVCALNQVICWPLTGCRQIRSAVHTIFDWKYIYGIEIGEHCANFTSSSHCVEYLTLATRS